VRVDGAFVESHIFTGWPCRAGQQNDRDAGGLPLQFVQKFDAGHLCPVTMEDDDVGIAYGIWGSSQRGACLHGKALLG